MTITLLGIVLCLMIGISLGLLGGGGSVLMVPVFVYVSGMSAEDAITLSLLVVGVTGLAGSVPYLSRGHVNLRLAAIFILFGSAGAVAGAKISYGVSGQLLLTAFGALMMIIGIFFFFSKTSRDKDGPITCRPKFLVSAVISTILGVLTGFLGVGGGFLIVPVLALIMKCLVEASIGTSLLILSANAFAGFAAHIVTSPIRPLPAAVFTLATLAGVIAGSLSAGQFSPILLKRGFSILIIGLGAYLIIKNVSGGGL